MAKAEKQQPANPGEKHPVASADEFAGWTRLGLVVDRSGSMSSLKADMDNALKVWLSEVQATASAKRSTLTSVLFDTEQIWEGPTPLLEASAPIIMPRNGTALYDAVGAMVGKVTEQVDPGDRALVIVITDGHENSSHEWSWVQLSKLIEDKKADGNWTFVFLASNMKEVSNAALHRTVGRQSGLGYRPDSAGVVAMTQSLTNSSVGYMGQNVAATEDFFEGAKATDLGGFVPPQAESKPKPQAKKRTVKSKTPKV